MYIFFLLPHAQLFLAGRVLGLYEASVVRRVRLVAGEVGVERDRRRDAQSHELAAEVGVGDGVLVGVHDGSDDFGVYLDEAESDLFVGLSQRLDGSALGFGLLLRVDVDGGDGDR